jgi:TP901 family phage tail tape measure protein
MASYEAYLGVGIDASGAQAGATQFNNATDKMSAASRKFQQQLDQAMFALKAFAVATAGLVVREISNFTQALSNARAMTNATAADMARLDKVTRDLGASTAFSATQVADAAAMLGQAGFSVDQIAKTLPATLDLAAAATIGMAQAADITAGAMAGFGIAAENSSQVADILAAVATGAKTDITGLGEAMKMVGPVAKSVGWTLGETTAILGVLANKNIEGSMAGTALKSVISSLVNPTKAATASINSLGLSVDDIRPGMVDSVEIFKRLAAANLDTTTAFQIFGERGAVGVLAVTDALKDLDKMTGVVSKADGAARRMAEIKLDNLAGDFEQLTGALSELALKVGDTGLTGSLRSLLQEVTNMINSFGSLWQEILKNKEQAELLASALNLVKNAVIAIIALKLAEWLFLAGNAMRLLNVAMSANPYTMLAVGLGTLALHLKDLQKETDNLTEYTNKQTDALEQMGNKGVVAANKVRIAMLEAQKESIGVLAEINNQIDAMNRSAKEQEDVKKRMYDPFGAKQKMAGANDPGTFNALVETQHNRDIGLLLKKKAAIEEIDKKIAGLNTTVKVYGDISDTNFMKAQRAAERMLGIAGGFVGGNIIGGKPAASAESKSSASGKSKITDIIQPREKPIYDNDGMMSLAFEQMGILKQESDKIIATFKQQEESKQRYLEGIKKLSEAEQRRLELNIALSDNAAEIDTQMQMYNATREYGLEIGSEEYRQLEEQINAQKTAAAGIKELEKARANEAEQARKASEAQKQWNNQLTYAFKDAIMNSKNLGDALSNLANRVQDMLVNKALDSLLGNFMGGFAKGAAFQAGGVTAFASGGVVNSPTMFPMRGGVGLMGEAGAEAIMPLTRTSSGDLGVKAVGAGTVVNTSININVSGGTKEQNDDAGRKVSAAVKQAIDDSVISVILREKRPGGVLNAA